MYTFQKDNYIITFQNQISYLLIRLTRINSSYNHNFSIVYPGKITYYDENDNKWKLINTSNLKFTNFKLTNFKDLTDKVSYELIELLLRFPIGNDQIYLKFSKIQYIFLYNLVYSLLNNQTITGLIDASLYLFDNDSLNLYNQKKYIGKLFLLHKNNNIRIVVATPKIEPLDIIEYESSNDCEDMDEDTVEMTEQELLEEQEQFLNEKLLNEKLLNEKLNLQMEKMVLQ